VGPRESSQGFKERSIV